MDLKKEKIKNDPLLIRGNGSIQDRLKYLSRDRTTRKTAELWGISTATLNAYINKGTEPSISRAKNICEAEGVTLEWLVSGENAEQGTSIEEPLIDIESDLNFIRECIEDMPPEALRKLCKRIRSKGTDSLNISERDDRILALVADLSDDEFKEIFAFVRKAKYMLLAGLEIDPAMKVEADSGKKLA